MYAVGMRMHRLTGIVCRIALAARSGRCVRRRVAAGMCGLALRIAAACAICLFFAQEHVGQSANSIGGNVVAAPPPFAGLVWTFTGPQPSAAAPNSSPAFGNTSGRISALAVDQTDLSGNTVYAGAAQGGVWRSTDGGQTWNALTDMQLSLA